MRTPAAWSRRDFIRVLGQVKQRTGLTDAEIGTLAGMSRSQANRWARAESRPSHDPVRRLVVALRGYPRLEDLPDQLLKAAGYSEDSDTPQVVRVPVDSVAEQIKALRLSRREQQMLLDMHEASDEHLLQMARGWAQQRQQERRQQTQDEQGQEPPQGTSGQKQ